MDNKVYIPVIAKDIGILAYHVLLKPNSLKSNNVRALLLVHLILTVIFIYMYRKTQKKSSEEEELINQTEEEKNETEEEKNQTEENKKTTDENFFKKYRNPIMVFILYGLIMGVTYKNIIVQDPKRKKIIMGSASLLFVSYILYFYMSKEKEDKKNKLSK